MGKPDMKTSDNNYVKVSTNDNDLSKNALDIPRTYKGYGVRHTQLLLMFTSMTVAFIARSHLGVTIVAMTKHKSTINETENTINVLNDTVNITNTGAIVDDDVDDWSVYREYDWPKSIQEMALGSFFVGYFLMMLPIGWVCQRWGGMLPLQISMLVNGVVSILTPWLVMLGGWKALCACRIAQGLSQTGMFPGIHTLLAQWVPNTEMASMGSYVYTGTTSGMVIAFPLAGVLSDTELGWPGTFWVVGVICLLCFLFLTYFGAKSPDVHKSVSEEEKLFIKGFAEDKVQITVVPWKEIFTSRAVWAIIATHVCSGMATVFFFTQISSYIHYNLGINVKQSGLLSSLPFILNFITSISFGAISDFLTNRNIITAKNARRIFNSISQFGMASMLICASYANTTATAVTCLTLAMGCNAGIHCGWMTNIIDIAPNFAGTLVALGNTLMNVGNILLPVMTSHVVVDVHNSLQWRIMIFLIAGIAVVTNIIFVIFISSDVQHWNYANNGDTDIEETKLDSEKSKVENK